MTNFCTFAPDGIGDCYWGDICEEHDMQYRKYEKTCTRKEADLDLYNGMKKRIKGYLFFLPYLYYIVVRLLCGPSWERWKYKWYLGIVPVRRKDE